MTESSIILDAEDLSGQLTRKELLLVDVRSEDDYDSGHIPGAIRLDYSDLVEERPPAKGEVPPEQKLSALFSRMGLAGDKHVVAYDRDAGADACRLLWTLDIIGHENYSLLDGGYAGWSGRNYPCTNESAEPESTGYDASIDTERLSTCRQILDKLGDETIVLLDARSPEEFSGEKILAKRGGHIPGAVNLDWRIFTDANNNFQLIGRNQILSRCENLGISPQKEIIPYCQTHRRSSHMFIVLKYMGFKNVHPYPGSWSEWGNISELPVEISRSPDD